MAVFELSCFLMMHSFSSSGSAFQSRRVVERHLATSRLNWAVLLFTSFPSFILARYLREYAMGELKLNNPCAHVVWNTFFTNFINVLYQFSQVD